MAVFFTVIVAITCFFAGYIMGLWDAGHLPEFFPRKMPKILRYRPVWWYRIFK